MTHWQVLEIESTKDIKKIKRAYAIKLKKIDIDNEPDKFQQLKEAFDCAINEVKIQSELHQNQEVLSNTSSTDELPLSDDSHTEKLNSMEITDQAIFTIDDNQSELLEEPCAIVNNFFTKLNSFTAELTYFDDLAGWQLLLTGSKDWDIDTFSTNQQIIYSFLSENHYQIMSHRVLKYIVDTIDLHSLIENSHSMEMFNFLEDLLCTPDFDFSIYQNISEESREKYFRSRYLLYLNLNFVPINHDTILELSEACLKITNTDPALIILQICYQIVLDYSLQTNDKAIVNNLLHQLEDNDFLNYSKVQDYLKMYILACSGQHKYVLPSKYINTKRLIPDIPFKLSAGYIAYKQKNNRLKQDYWQPLIKIGFKFENKQHQPVAKDEKNLSKFLMVAFFALIVITALGRSFSLTSKNTKISKQLTSISAYSSIYNSRYTRLKDASDLSSQLVYYLNYSSEEDEKDFQEFLDTYFSEHAKEQVLNVDKSKLTKNDSFGIFPTTDFVEKYGYVEAADNGSLSNPLFILQKENDIVVNILGPGFDELSDNDWTDLIEDIRVRPSTSSNIFFLRFLLSKNRKAESSSETFKKYFTDDVLALIDHNIDLTTEEKFKNAYDKLVVDPDEKKAYDLIFDKTDKLLMILSFNSYGCIDHIYGENWEELSTDKIDNLVALLEE